MPRAGSSLFRPERFFPSKLFEEITDVRVQRRDIVLDEARKRVRRKKLTEDGRLTLLAADHPARMVTAAGEDPLGPGR